jgi:hypothetical protein
LGSSPATSCFKTRYNKEREAMVPNGNTEEPESGEGIPGVSQPEAATAANGGGKPTPETPTSKVKAPKGKGKQAGKVEGEDKSTVPTPEGHPDTLTDDQKNYIHRERAALLKNTLKQIDERIHDLRKQGLEAGSMPAKWMIVPGVVDALQNRGYACDRSSDPLNWQVRFGKKG